MTEKWKEGDPVPDGFRSDTIVGAAAHLILHAMTLRADVDGSVDVEAMFRAWANTVEKNGPDGTANLLMAVGTLAAGAYFQLSALTETPPGALLTTDAEIAEAMLRVMFGGDA